jgi:hypothetical protein
MLSNIEVLIVCIIFIFIVLFKNKNNEKFQMLKNNSI